MLQGFVGDVEIRLQWPAELFLGLLHVLLAEWRAMSLERILLGRAESEVRAYDDHRRFAGFGTGVIQRFRKRRYVIAVVDPDDLPAVSFEALAAVLGKSDVGAGGEADGVVVIEADQLAQLQVPGQRCCFSRHAFHHVAVADDRPSVMIDHGMAVAIVAAGEMGFANRHADGIGHPLAERPGGHFHAGHVAPLRMTRRLAVPLAEALYVGHREVIAGHVQQAVEQRRTVAG